MKWIITLCCLLCALVGCRQPGSTGKPLPDIEGAYRAMRSIDAALVTGVTFVEYGSLIRALNTELLILSDKIKLTPEGTVDPRVVKLLDGYEKVAEKHKKAHTVWSAQVQNRLRAAADIVKEYNFKVDDLDSLESLRQMIWQEAQMKTVQVLAGTYGR